MEIINLSNTNQGDRGVKREEVVFDLSTLEASRKTFSEIIKAYAAGDISEQKARALGYLMNYLLPYWKTEMDMRIEERLEAIEKAIEEAGK